MELNRITDIPGLNEFYQVDDLFLAGQPQAESFEHLKKYGFESVINLRAESEADFSHEQSFCHENGISYFHLPIMGDSGLIRENLDKVHQLALKDGKHFIHCASANRVGAWLITFLVEEKKMDFDQALEIAMQSGLTKTQLVATASKALERNEG